VAQISIPDQIRAELEAGAHLAISISGGKDSQAMLSALVRAHREHGWKGELFAIHADLGRMEWTETPAFVEELAARYGVKLVITRREKGDLVDRMQDRMTQLEGTGKPFWPSSAQRYCTSDLKRDPIDKALRRHHSYRIVVAIGIRADESPARARKPMCAPRSRIETAQRRATDWHPIFEWTEEDVWNELGWTLEQVNNKRAEYRLAPKGAGEEDVAFIGWNAHPAYIYGNERLSCALCIMASKNDLLNGARRHPELFNTLLEMERTSGCTFTQKLSLAELAEEI